MIQENATFFEKMTACFGELSDFEKQIQQIAEMAQIDLSRFQIDHLAVRMNSLKTAQKWRAFLLENAILLKESEVNGRPIGLFELPQAVEFCGQFVNVIELPFPKGKIYPVEGWEHIEVVVPMQPEESVEEWCCRCLAYFKLANHDLFKIKISQPEVNGEQLPNPTIAITIKNETLDHSACLKLHPYDIKRVIYSEKVF